MKKSPDAFRTISEVAEALDTPAHVLRFWESRFTQIKPVKRAGGRRYYRPADVALLGGIKHLLHDEGMTIRGVQKVLREHGIRHVSALSDEEGPVSGVGMSGALPGTLPDAPVEVELIEAEPEPPRDNVVALGAARAARQEAEAAAEEPPAIDAIGTEAPAENAAPAEELPAATLPDVGAPVDEGDPEEAPAIDAQSTAPLPDTPLPEAPLPDIMPPEADAPVQEPPAPLFDTLPLEEAPADEAPSEKLPAEDTPAELPTPGPLFDMAALDASTAESSPPEPEQPPLSTRLRALPPQPVSGPDGEELARLADALKALRHKMAGHARRGGR